MSWWLKKKKKNQIVSYSLQKAPWLKPREIHFRFFYCQSYNRINLCCFNRKAEVFFFFFFFYSSNRKHIHCSWAFGRSPPIFPHFTEVTLGPAFQAGSETLLYPQCGASVQGLYRTPPLGGMALAGRDEEPLPLTSPTYCLLFTKPAASTSLRTRIPMGHIEPFLLP